MAFENASLAAEHSDHLSHASADTEGFTPLQLEAIPGQLRSQPPTAPAKPFTPNEKKQVPNSPGIHDGDLHGHSQDGGKVTFDKAGNITFWESKDKSTSRTYIYHDTAKDRSGLYGIKNESVFQDQNGTYFQFADVNGQKTPIPKLFTRGFNSKAFADLRGSSRSDAMFDRAVDPDGAPTIVPISLQQNLKISATLDMVTDNHGHIWKRDQPGKPLTEYIKTESGKEIKLGKKFTDAQLLPVDLYVSAKRQKLYQDEKHPLDSIKAVSVEQTELGDCYFEGSVAEVAKTNPERIAAMIQDNHDGTYTVKFPLSDPTFSSKVDFSKRPTLDVTVEAPTPPEMSTFNLPFDKKQNFGYWSSVMEKAHRYLTGKITEDDGGVGADGLQLLTGVRKVTNFDHPSTTSDSGQHPFQKQTFTGDPRDTQDPKLDSKWLTELKDALEKGEPVVAHTPTKGSEWVIITGGTDDKKVLGQSSEPGHEQNKFHILDRHIYSVIRVDHQDHGAEDLITIRNPLANVIPADAKDTVRPFDKKDDGYFQVRASDFENLFDGFFIN
ncbi:MAG: C2 family cysteine protease [Candidatus Obscuribacterales bacterium]|nr:C2 family cysteine protease [Candidatus Obscuribacterales bacterium]